MEDLIGKNELADNYKVDKSTFPPGPWMTEPDKIEWRDKKTSYPCMIIRTQSGTLCGYVGITEDHQYFAKSYDDVPVSVHGGLTYGDVCSGHICHIPLEGEKEVFWFGFDCAHSQDYIPGFAKIMSIPGWNDPANYRDLAYVKAEVTSLAAQLKEIEK